MDDQEALGYFGGDDFKLEISVVDSDVEPSRVTAFGGDRRGFGCGYDVADMGFADTVLACRLREPQLHARIMPPITPFRQDIIPGGSSAATIRGDEGARGEARRLLAKVRRASEAIDAAQEAGRQSVQQAMDAGIPRDEIADAALVHRVTLYKLLKS